MTRIKRKVTLALALLISASLSIVETSMKGQAIPYYTWASRGKSPMQIGLPNRVGEMKSTD